MLILGVIFALVSVASAGYASSGGAASAGAGLYSDSSYSDTYGSKYPYTNNYAGYASAGGLPYAVPVGPFANPYDFQNSFAAYYNSISEYNRNLFNQQLQYQAAIQNSIQANLNNLNHAAFAGAGGAAYGGGYGYQPQVAIPSRFGGASAGTGFASGGAFAGTGGGGVTGSYGGVGTGGQVYGGTSGGGRPVYSSSGNRYPSGGGGGGNYASAGGSVSSNGHSQQHAAIYPANPARPNLDSRFGADDSSIGVSHSSAPGGGPGFVGVSSFSSSSDINGVKNRESGTSVNKNGQVTTYYTRN